MPKGISEILDEEKRREEALLAYINSKKGKGRMYRNDSHFAEKAMVVSSNAFSKWKNSRFPAFFHTLCRMFQKTHITDRELCLVFGVEYKGRTTE